MYIYIYIYVVYMHIYTQRTVYHVCPVGRRVEMAHFFESPLGTACLATRYVCVYIYIYIYIHTRTCCVHLYIYIYIYIERERCYCILYVIHMQPGCNWWWHLIFGPWFMHLNPVIEPNQDQSVNQSINQSINVHTNNQRQSYHRSCMTIHVELEYMI